jgi:Kef-type K+ transport system membrane component KefB
MSNPEIGSIVLALAVIIGLVHTLGFCFERMRQPRLVGEIITGVVLGPFVLGHFLPSASARLFGMAATSSVQVVLNFLYWIGLFLLMFLSGSETRRLLGRENRRETAWLFGLGTTLPFCLVMFLGMASLIPLSPIMGQEGRTTPVLLVLAVSVSVTSIPVISRIFIDLGIIQTRFASLVLGFAVLEDIALWAVLTVATGLAKSPSLNSGVTWQIFVHVLVTFAYMAAGLGLAPRLLRLVHDGRWNLLIKASPTGYLFFVLFIYIALAGLLDINLVFAAFLAGFGLVGGMQGNERARFSAPLESVSKVGTGVFIPIYFAIVGYKLSLGRGFSLTMLVEFALISSVIAMVSFAVAARVAGFNGLDLINLIITKNARGGPGIVLASVAYDAGLINAQFYTTLVLTAVLTSQAAGAWLRFILGRGLPLLSESPAVSETAVSRAER